MAVIKEIAWNDGEAITDADLNNMQRFNSAKINDAMLRRLLRTNSESQGGSDAICYSLGVGGEIAVTGTALRSTNSTGTIVQEASTAVIDGSTPKTLLYSLAANELQTDHAAAHATLDRWDIICVKLEEVVADTESRDFKDATTGLLSTTTPTKRRNVLLTKQVVQGTNMAAGTAVEPAVPAGYCKWAAVFIPATFAAVFVATTHFRDWRFPANSMFAGIITANQMANNSFGTVGARTLTSTLSNQQAFAFLPRMRAGKVMRLRVRAKITDASGGNIALVRQTMTAAGGATVISPLSHTGGVDATLDIIADGGRIFADTLYGPIWLNAHQCGPATSEGTGDEVLGIRFESGAVGDTVSAVHYWIGE